MATEEKPVIQKRVYTITQFMAAFSLSRSMVYKLIKTGELRTVTIGRRRYVPVEAAEALLKDAA